MTVQEVETIEVRFDGGIAATGRLHFYEYSRAQYGVARLISTIEYFRRNKKVLSRVTKKDYVEMIVEAPKKGSFLETVMVLLSEEAAGAAISVPLSVLMTYVWSLLFGRSKRTDDDLIELAKILSADRALDREMQEKFLEIARNEQANTRQALSLLKVALTSTNPQLAETGKGQERLLEMQSEILEENLRDNELKQHQAALAEIDAEDMAKLTSRVRPIIPNIALPLRRSAKTVAFGAKGKKPTVTIDKARADSIDSRVVDDEQIVVNCHVKSYDRDSGVGKLIASEFEKNLVTFVVPFSVRQTLLTSVLEAMRQDKVDIVVNAVRDKSGVLVSLIMVDILPVQED